MNDKTLAVFNEKMRTLEKLTGESDLLNEFEQEYMDLPDYDASLKLLVVKLAECIKQLRLDGIN